MTDDNQCAIVGVQRRFQRLDCVNVEMVARLIEKQELTRLAVPEHAGQSGP